MTENHVTKDEFNGYAQRTDAAILELQRWQKEGNEKTSAIAKDVAGILVYQKMLPVQIEEIMSRRTREDSKWKMGIWIPPALTAGLAVLATMLATHRIPSS